MPLSDCSIALQGGVFPSFAAVIIRAFATASRAPLSIWQLPLLSAHLTSQLASLLSTNAFSLVSAPREFSPRVTSWWLLSRCD